MSVLGRIRPLEPVRAVRAVPASGGPTLAAIDLLELADDLPYPSFSGYVELVEQQPSGQAQPEPVAPPQQVEGPHLAYAVQWSLLSGLALAGYVMFARQEAQQGRARQPQPQSTSPGDDGSAAAALGSPTAASSMIDS